MPDIWEQVELEQAVWGEADSEPGLSEQDLLRAAELNEGDTKSEDPKLDLPQQDAAKEGELHAGDAKPADPELNLVDQDFADQEITKEGELKDVEMALDVPPPLKKKKSRKPKMGKADEKEELKSKGDEQKAKPVYDWISNIGKDYRFLDAHDKITPEPELWYLDDNSPKRVTSSQIVALTINECCAKTGRGQMFWVPPSIAQVKRRSIP